MTPKILIALDESETASIASKAIVAVSEPACTDIAEEIVEEACEGTYSMVVLSKGVLGTAKSIVIVLESIASEISHSIQGMAVTIVG